MSELVPSTRPHANDKGQVRYQPIILKRQGGVHEYLHWAYGWGRVADSPKLYRSMWMAKRVAQKRINQRRKQFHPA